jgi:hypothetical protein
MPVAGLRWHRQERGRFNSTIVHRSTIAPQKMDGPQAEAAHGIPPDAAQTSSGGQPPPAGAPTAAAGSTLSSAKASKKSLQAGYR